MEETTSPNTQNGQGAKKGLAFLGIGLFEISFVLIIIIVLFGTLNYFNILSLSTLYPKQFGFLPHQKILNQPQITITNTPAPTHSTYSYTPIAEASASDISKYSAYAKTHLSGPNFNTDSKNYTIEGFFVAYNNNFVSILTSAGSLDFAISKDSVFNRNLFSPAEKNSDSAAGFKTITKENFNIKQNLGRILEIHYLTPSGSTEKLISEAFITTQFPFIVGDSAEFAKHYAYASSNFEDPSYSKEQQSYAVQGVLTSYTNNLLTLATSVGPMDFAIMDKTYLHFLSSSGESTITKDKLLAKENIGKNVTVFYLSAQGNSNTFPLKKVYLYDTGAH